MITPFDDYPIHQTAQPIAHAASGDANHYDRYFFNGYTEDFYFGAAMGFYPNRGTMDAAFSMVQGGQQKSVFSSGRIPEDRTQTSLGPISIEVREPMRRLALEVEAPEQGLSASLEFVARTPALEEPRQVISDGPQLVMDVTRITQWGNWQGTINNGREIRLPEVTYGTKDRSWGIRPVGAPAPGAPSHKLPQVFFLWSPINFDDFCTHFLVFENADGSRWQQSLAKVPVLQKSSDPVCGSEVGISEFGSGRYDLQWASGLRRMETAGLEFVNLDGSTEPVELERVFDFRMRGIGYTHPEWSHGTWIDELAVGGEQFEVGELDNLDPSNIHVQTVVRAQWQGRQGLGILEQMAFGEHAPTGLCEFLDGGKA